MKQFKWFFKPRRYENRVYTYYSHTHYLTSKDLNRQLYILHDITTLYRNNDFDTGDTCGCHCYKFWLKHAHISTNLARLKPINLAFSSTVLPFSTQTHFKNVSLNHLFHVQNQMHHNRDSHSNPRQQLHYNHHSHYCRK